MIMADSFLLNLNNKLIPLYNGLVLFYKGLDNLQSPLQLIHGPRRTGGQPDGGKLCGIPHSKTVGAEHLHAMDLGLDFKIVAAAAVRERTALVSGNGKAISVLGKADSGF